MGCLGFVLEAIGDGLVEGWFELMQWLIPEKMKRKKLRFVMKTVCYIFSMVLFLVFLFGVFALLSDDPETRRWGKYMVFIPAGISILQISAGIIGKIARKGRESNDDQ